MIGHSFPTLEELPYIPTMLNNPTNSIRSWVQVAVVGVFVVGWLVSRSLAQQTVPTTPPGGPEVPGAVLPSAGPGPGAPAGPGAPPGPGAPGPAPTAQPEEPPTETDRFVDSAIAKIAKIPSVSADLRQDVDMLHTKFSIKGQYLRAPQSHFKLHLLIEGLPDATGESLQNCDGETLWNYQLILDRAYYRKRSVKPILERLNSPEINPVFKNQIVIEMGFAGPEVLLQGLRKSVRFDQRDEAELEDGRKVWKIHGTWKNRQGLVGPDSRPVNPMGALPPYVPMDVRLFLGRDDSWPYRLELAGRELSSLIETRRIGPDGRPIGAKSSIERIPRTVITLVYSNVKLGGTIPNEDFAFRPPANATVDDDTELILKGLDRELEQEAMRKKNEAAQKEGATIDQPINLPSPPATTPNP
jgi:hypothetical protein